MPIVFSDVRLQTWLVLTSPPMHNWIVSYADAAFRTSQQRLMASAVGHGVNHIRQWCRKDLERTTLYMMNKAVLDKTRGGGYWLWKPFIIKETLKELDEDDVLIYSDAGMEIVADIRPVVEICRKRAPIMLFAGHYDDVGAPGPNLCGKWTKRDAFVFMDCDERQYHGAQLLDASFIVIAKARRSVAFVREWLLYCCQPQLLTDEPNVCQLPNLPEFIEHRHDQSLLSLLAVREGLEVFRHPSQFGNHLKEERYRQPGEWIRAAYGAHGIYRNSPYGTVLHHHRGDLGQQHLGLRLRRIIRAPREHVFDTWTKTDILDRWSPLGGRVVRATADVKAGGTYEVLLRGTMASDLHLSGTFLDVCPPRRLVYTWRWNTRVVVEFSEEDGGTAVVLEHEPFPSEKLLEYHRTAWNELLDALERVTTGAP